ncbi:hypothetical protein C5S32_12750 [ANME-1 cluster archaeon GoMg1]|nr:hypothetical protein [ANME-1 cluster archaeon GoMg1]
MQGRDNESEAESEPDPPNSSDNPSLGRINSIGMTTGKYKDKGSFWRNKGGRGTYEDEYETEYEGAKTAKESHIWERRHRLVPYCFARPNDPCYWF